MKNVLKTSCILVLLAGKLMAQDTLHKVKEFGIGLSSLNSYSLQYRWGNEKRLFRITGNISDANSNSTTSGVTNYQDSTNLNSVTNNSSTTPVNLNVGLSFSILMLKSITGKFGFMYGGILGISYLHNANSYTNVTSSPNIVGSNPFIYGGNSTSQTVQPYLGVSLGLFYKINSSFIIYADISPNIYYAMVKGSSTITRYDEYYPYSNFNSNEIQHTNAKTFGISGLSNSGATLTFIYRITKK